MLLVNSIPVVRIAIKVDELYSLTTELIISATIWILTLQTSNFIPRLAIGDIMTDIPIDYTDLHYCVLSADNIHRAFSGRMGARPTVYRDGTYVTRHRLIYRH